MSEINLTNWNIEGQMI